MKERLHFRKPDQKHQYWIRYSASLDTQLARKILVENGVPKNVAEKYSFQLAENYAKNQDYERTHDFKKKSIGIFVGHRYKSLVKQTTNVEKVISREISPSDDVFGDLLFTERLAKYLLYAPVKRGKKFAGKLLLKATNKILDLKLLHEIGNAVDFKVFYASKPNKEDFIKMLQIIFSLGTYFLCDLPLFGKFFYRKNQLEVFAEKFVFENIKNPEYQSLVTLHPGKLPPKYRKDFSRK